MLIKKLQQDMRIAGYSPRTIKSYTICAKNICKRFKKPLNRITEDDFKSFLASLAKKKYSPYTINLYHATLKYVTEKIYHKKFTFRFPYAKRHKKLPIVLSRKEIRKIIHSTKNSKHRLLIALSYGAGLRVSEAVSLKVADLDLAELTLHIKKSKGKRDRITIIPKRLKTDLQNLIAGKKPRDFLFEASAAAD